MKVLFNASTLVKGGALQVATSFIREAMCNKDGLDWHYALSKAVVKELTEAEFAGIKANTTVFEVSPARSKIVRKQLTSLHADTGSAAVFTLFGPAYVKFNGPHICGVADGWVTHSGILAFKALGSVSSAIRMLLTIVYKAFWFRKANAWIVEAMPAKQGLVNRLRIEPELIHVISNTCSQFYRNRQVESRFPKHGEKVRLLCLSAYFPGKNLKILPEVAMHIRAINAQLDFEFVLTLPLDDSGLKQIIDKAKLLGVEEHICNIGTVRVSDGPDVYERCHISFLPSLLETFSANYPEAMAMKRPIVTTDLGFAHDACKDAALYYEPLNAKAAAEKILMLVNNPDLWAQLVDNGSKVLAELPTPEQRFERYIDIIKSCNAENAC
jgi:glycosyltransferase involved in cell wall biosynthesis